MNEIRDAILNNVDKSVIPWWMRCWTLSILPSFAWSAGDIEMKGGKARRSREIVEVADVGNEFIPTPRGD